MMNINTHGWSLVTILNLLLVSSLNAETLVKISQGFLNGTIFHGHGRNYSAFIGIPYAAPPIGNLRFRSPVPGKSWDGVRSATETPNECPQLLLNENVIGNEDCLYLNVYSPIVNFNSTLEKNIHNGSLLPVMVWFHGGGFFSGSSDPKVFNPNYLLQKDIILVTMNYRLGVLGFFSTGNEFAPGNFGLKDQVMSLKWIQKNIQAFGGDPQRVTIFGSSAGGLSVNLHALSNATHGLFHQYIIQSGSAITPWAYKDRNFYKSFSKTFADSVGCGKDDVQDLVECLRETDVEKLVKQVKYEHFDFPMLHWTSTDEPESEEAFLTDSPQNLIKQNKMKDLPSIYGSDVDEGMIITLPFYINKAPISMIKAFKRTINLTSNHYAKPEEISNFEKMIQNFYAADKSKLLENYTKFVGDSGFLYPKLLLIENTAKNIKSPVYFYSFGYRGTVNLIFFERNVTENFGAPHGDDILYLFAIVPKNFVLEKDEKMINLMTDLWTNFAINGKPTSGSLENPNIWKPYQENNSFLQIGNINNHFEPSVTLENVYFPERMNFWKKNFPLI
ncbi:juvenile hormone esterase-like [Leptopilina heterotoma]|uniref:juvenile hormone esterase-like n=1 Tax=Leptopilina heterotoma TaxID=63436 RepID=UPI001CA8AF5B|nr:juvenile hormone esterase-like [Leptopilina heterotoma]XP_043476978.1 juvenile hormone esterase-like [Leptopilina heterotoma]XP_043476979.1 juvenile hormone esterase-like [Leptopilina heterotoma]